MQDEMTLVLYKHTHFYNTERIHSTVGSISPNQYESIF
ncbi:IS3 family transposase [Methylosoma difficile]